MKKFLAFFLAAVLLCSTAIAFAGCGEKTESTTSDKATGDSATGDSASPDSAGSKGELHMATNAEFPPYEYMENNEIVGIDAEIAQAICDKLGYTLVIDNMKFDAVIPAVTSGKADFAMAGLSVTPDRQEEVDFTDTYADTTQVIIVKEGSDKVKSANDLNGATVGVQLGTTGQTLLQDKYPNAKLNPFSKGSEAVEALSTGKVDAVVIDSEPAKEFVKAKDGLTILDDKFDGETYAIALQKNSSLTSEFNKALAELKNDGTLDSIVNKYAGKN